MVIFGDAAVFPFSCYTNRPANRVMIHIMTEKHNEENEQLYYEYASLTYYRKAFKDFKIGDTITEDDIMGHLGEYDDIENLPYTIEKYQIMLSDHINHKDITLPYVAAGEDKLNYLWGMRGYVHLVVIVKMHAEEGTSA